MKLFGKAAAIHSSASSSSLQFFKLNLAAENLESIISEQNVPGTVTKNSATERQYEDEDALVKVEVDATNSIHLFDSAVKKNEKNKRCYSIERIDS